MCRFVLQCVAVCCSVLQCVAAVWQGLRHVTGSAGASVQVGVL